MKQLQAKAINRHSQIVSLCAYGVTQHDPSAELPTSGLQSHDLSLMLSLVQTGPLLPLDAQP